MKKFLFSFLFIFLVFCLFSSRPALATVGSIEIDSPTSANKAYVTANNDVTVNYTFTSNANVGYTGFIYLKQNNITVAQNNITADFGIGTFSSSGTVNVGVLSEGLYDLEIILSTASASNSSSVVIDNTPPTALTVLYPSADKIALQGNSVSAITWTATSHDVNFGTTPIGVFYSSSGTFLNPVNVANLPASATSTAWTVPGVSTNTAKVLVRAIDLAGNYSFDESNYAFTIDAVAPSVSSATASPDPANDTSVTVTVVFDEVMNIAVSPTVTVPSLGFPMSVTQSTYTGSTWTGTLTIPDTN